MNSTKFQMIYQTLTDIAIGIIFLAAYYKRYLFYRTFRQTED